MDEFPLVSVITPSYNHGKYIRDTIESVVNQTYKNIEYFVIDDGSTDNSRETIASLEKEYHFDFEFHQNKGLAFTMNKLIAKCKGKYVAVIESDDVWTLDKIEKQVAFLESHLEFAACGGYALYIDERNEVLPYRQQEINKYRIYNLEDIMSFTYQIFPLTVMMRRDIYEMMGKFDESLLYIDAYTWLKTTVNNYTIVILPNLFGYYRVHESNVHWDSLKMYEALMKTIDKFKDHSLYSKARRSAISYIFPYLAVNDKMKAISILPETYKLRWRMVKGLFILLIPFRIIKLLTKTRYE